MIIHPIQYCQKLTETDVEKILEASLYILKTKGLIIQSPEACRVLAEAGACVDLQRQNVTFPEDLVLDSVAKAPGRWTLHARNPEHNVPIGGRTLVVAPGYGSAFIADGKGTRRESTMKDFEKMALLSGASPAIDITGGLLVEPNDITAKFRPLEITYALITHSDKPFMGSVAGAEGAEESLAMSRILFGDLERKPCVMALININSPLRLDGPMAEALLAYVRAGQPILLTPGIMMGISAPVTLVGAMVQGFAELLGCAALVQILRPGCPLIIGLGGVGSDLRNGTTGFGRPENALGIQVGAQIARHLNLPFRCSAAVTSSRKPDCRSGYERMMTALTAYNAGAHLCLQAAGILDSINMMSYEQYMIDIEIWAYIKRLSKPIQIDEQTKGLDVIDFHTENYLAHEHTVRYMREELFVPSLVDPESYEQWFSSNGKDIVSKARQMADRILKNVQPPPLDEGIRKDLQNYMNQRKKIRERI
jgi:trimethylamine--corrinoid protein Co-methyltransferase